MSRGDLHEALIEKAAKAIHALDCCPMDSESGGCSYPVDACLEAKEAQAVLRAVADDIRAEALEAAAAAEAPRHWRELPPLPGSGPLPDGVRGFDGLMEAPAPLRRAPARGRDRAAAIRKERA